MKEHKHAAILRAIADGKDVEHYSNGAWNLADSYYLENIFDPFTFSNDEWRIKPEPKKDVTVNTSCVHCLHEGWTKVTQLTLEFMYASNLKLTFDGETGKLKSAEVIK